MEIHAMLSIQQIWFFPLTPFGSTQIHLHNARVCVCAWESKCVCALDYSAVSSLCCPPPPPYTKAAQICSLLPLCMESSPVQDTCCATKHSPRAADKLYENKLVQARVCWHRARERGAEAEILGNCLEFRRNSCKIISLFNVFTKAI